MNYFFPQRIAKIQHLFAKCQGFFDIFFIYFLLSENQVFKPNILPDIYNCKSICIYFFGIVTKTDGKNKTFLTTKNNIYWNICNFMPIIL